MLLEGLYDFTARKEDSHKTLGFNQGDVLMFLEVYLKDGNWLCVVDSTGRIGYIPRNYVKLSTLEVTRDSVLQFLLIAIYKAQREKLDSLEILERLKDDIGRIEFREFQTRLLRQALQYKEQPEVEIEDGTTYTCDSDYKLRNARHNGSVTSVFTSRSERTHISTRTEPPHPNISTEVLNVTHHSRDSGETLPLQSRPSQSCQQVLNQCGDSRVPKAPPLPTTPVVRQLLRNIVPNSSSEPEPNREQKMTAKLVKIVQESGGLDLKRSETVVHRILYHMKNHFSPDLPESISSVLRILEQSPSTNYNNALLDEDEPEPSRRVKAVLSYLNKFNKHSLHTRGYIEEESVFLDKLDQLEEDMGKMDGSTMRRTIQPKAIEDLMAFYQSETRNSIKSKMIDIFSMIAALDNETRSLLGKSALPILLGKELLGSEESPRKLSRLANTLTSLMSSGYEPLPQTHLESLGTRFLTFLLNYLEDSPQSRMEEDETTKSDFVTLLLAYNLQFTPRDENLLIKTLASRTPGRYFMEALMNLFESGVDPVRRYGGRSNVQENSSSHPHPVFKLLQDMFSSKKTAEHFHKADMKWLTDLIFSNVSTLGSGNQRRTEYLQLLWLVLRNRAFQYRIKDIREALVGILLEEDALSIPDQRIVKSMSKEFPTIFKKGSASSITKTDSAF